MFDHLSGNHRQFFDPDKLHRPIRHTGLMRARLSEAISLPVVNCGFLRSDDHVAFSALGRSVEDVLVEVGHSGFFVNEAGWVGSTTVDCGGSGEAWRHSGVVFDTELAVDGWPVARTRIRIAGCDGLADSSFADRDGVETTALDLGWFLVRLIAPVAGDYQMTADSEIRIPWGDLYRWYWDRGLAPGAP